MPNILDTAAPAPAHTITRTYDAAARTLTCGCSCGCWSRTYSDVSRNGGPIGFRYVADRVVNDTEAGA